jgi:anti-sigma regulatory factor (Ser/Thr protein kinase)
MTAPLVDAVPYIAFELPAEATGAAVVRRAVAEFAIANGAGEEVADRVRLAVSEAFNNAITHAFPMDDGSVHVAADVEDGDLEVVVSDDGLGFRPGVSPGMGLGLLVIERCCDVFLVRNRIPQGVEVWMRFWLD